MEQIRLLLLQIWAGIRKEEFMLDQYGRKIEYIRISITDRCNLRCMYCMPETGVEQVEHSDILRYDEIVRLTRIMSELGISKVKITGGEPLVRKDAAELIKSLKALPGIDNVTLTTNGILLKEQMKALDEAGLDAVNISLDALDETAFERITRRRGFSQVMEGMEEALGYSHIRVKINCVLMEGINEDQWIPIAGLAKKYDLDVRFIEMMPIGIGARFCGETQQEVTRLLEEAYGPAVPVSGRFGNGPGTYMRIDGFKGKIGFISAMSHKFCKDCNRIRLTSEGFLKPCLQFATGCDLRPLLREEACDEEIRKQIEKTIFRKPRSHRFEERGQEGFENRKMSEIGG